MRKFVFLLILVLTPGVFARAQVNRVIKLKNGTIMRGQVLSYKDGQYIINNPRYGKVRIKENNVVSIEDSSTKTVYTSVTEKNPPPVLQKADPSQQQDRPTQADLERIQSQPSAQYLKQRIENDPGLQQDFQSLLENKEVMQTLTDPTVMQAIIKGDTNTLMKNKAFQDLINNPDMQKIIQKTLREP
jgi:hypothetical protein